ncbi:tetratricopeptide repeat protein [bacterium]|nr:tetratricopeptide repeat protein [bacterium]NIN93061.1 tetratricopeptide repeat protein [bacterium]NIO18930.1 tetratricopeptide repeat protein [bacterium]NIO74011.1 tetratricopeptide repeat protein [bacterium]
MGIKINLLKLLISIFLLTSAALVYGGDVIVDGEQYLNRWNIDKAMQFAQRAVLEKPQKADSFRLLGLAHFYQGNYEKAIEYLQTASLMEPGNAQRKRLLYFVEGTKEITEEFSDYSSEHFALHLADKDNLLVEYALEALEKAYQEIQKELNYFPEEKILVEVYPTTEGFTHASSLSPRQIEVSGAIGICKFNRIMIISPRCLVYGYRWLDALAHEFIHYVLAKLTGLNMPLWLNEGLAKYHETRWRVQQPNYLIPVYKNALSVAARERKWVDFWKMKRGMPSLESREEVILAFAQVSLAVDYLLRHQGRNKLTHFLHELGKTAGKGKEESFEQMEKRWDALFRRFFGMDQKKFQGILKDFLQEMDLEQTPGVALDSFKLKEEGKEVDELEEYIGVGARGHVRLGDMYRQRRRHNVALIQYEKGLRKEPNNHVILNKIGKTCSELGRFGEAEESFKKSLQVNPNYGPTYTNLATLYFIQEKLIPALENYQESNHINPFNPLIHKYMGLIHYRLGEEAKAKREWTIARRLLAGDIEVESWLLEIERKKSRP